MHRNDMRRKAKQRTTDSAWRRMMLSNMKGLLTTGRRQRIAWKLSQCGAAMPANADVPAPHSGAIPHCLLTYALRGKGSSAVSPIEAAAAFGGMVTTFIARQSKGNSLPQSRQTT